MSTIAHPLFTPGAGSRPAGFAPFNRYTTDEDSVAHQSVQYQKMLPDWNLIDDLYGGTETMRSRAVQWLPLEPRESLNNYDVRLKRSYLFAALGDTVDKLVDKPFSREVMVPEDAPLPDVLSDLTEDMTRQGQDITQFAKEQFEGGVKYGLNHILVDHPQMTGRETRRDVLEGGIRPFMVTVLPRDLIGWRTEISRNGQHELSQIRILETRIIDEGNFSSREVLFVRVFERERWALYQEVDPSKRAQGTVDFKLVDEGVNSLGKVPLITWYTKRNDYMMGVPPLKNLAWLNVAHWQSWSDLRNTLRHVLAAILFAKGLSEELGELEVGPQNFIEDRGGEGTLEYVEHSGKGVESGRKELERLEEQMQVLGLQPLISQRVRGTATGHNIDNNRSESQLQSWVRACEGGVYDAIALAAEWIRVKLPEKFNVDIFSDFSINVRGQENAPLIIELRKLGDIDQRTTLDEVKKYGVLSETVDTDEVLEATQAEQAEKAKLFADQMSEMDDNADAGAADDNDDGAESDDE